MKVDAERKLTYNCDPAAPKKIDFTWLEKNPGKLFNTPLVLEERQMMLENTRNSSCEQNCFKAEDVGAISPRILRQGYIKTHSDIIAEPELIDLTIGSDCNLSCSYCFKEYSSAWRHDLLTNGNYDTVKMDDDRFTINFRDKVINRNSQPIRVKSNHFQLLLDEMQILSKSLKTLIITGGEPLLNNSLFDILDKVSNVPDIKLFTGLGVDYKRFTKLVEKLKQYTNVWLSVSAESTEKNYEFNRYGNKWNEFVTKIEFLEKNNITFSFHSSLSNLTILGLSEFYEKFANRMSSYDLVYNPDFMAVYVLDDHTKQRVIDKLNTLDTSVTNWHRNHLSKEFIIQSMQVEPTQKQRDNIREFLKEFTRRRPDLDVTLYPKEFLKWIDYVV